MNSRLQSTHSDVLECVTEQSKGQAAVELPEPIRAARSAQTTQSESPQENLRLSDQLDKPVLAKAPCCGCCGG